jgi:hypothetical protein
MKTLSLRQFQKDAVNKAKADYQRDYGKLDKVTVALIEASAVYNYDSYLNEQAKKGEDIPYYILDTLEPVRLRFIMRSSPENSPIRKYILKEVRNKHTLSRR